MDSIQLVIMALILMAYPRRSASNRPNNIYLTFLRLSFGAAAVLFAGIIISMPYVPGKIILAANINVWPHEMKTAQALVRAGYTVEFIKKSDIDHMRTADVLIEGMHWEIKSPKSNRTDMIQKNLRRALHQSRNVIFDSRRMKNLPNKVIEREVRLRSRELRTLKRLLYINKNGDVVVIK